MCTMCTIFIINKGTFYCRFEATACNIRAKTINAKSSFKGIHVIYFDDIEKLWRDYILQ